MREALELINRTLDEVLAEQEGDFDSDSRRAVAWFEQHGFDEGDYGVAETLSKAKNTSVAGLVEAGILASKGGTVRLLKPDQLPEDWDPATDARLTAWEMVHHLVRVLEAGGESAAAEIASRLGAKAEVARELCYRLYTLCERKKRASEAPTKEMLDTYKKKSGTWEDYERRFVGLMAERRIEEKIWPESLEDACLLCSEDQPHHCHRRLVAEYLKEHWGDVEIEHLG